MDTPMGSTMGPGGTYARDTGTTNTTTGRKSAGTCSACGQPLYGNRINSGLEHFLGKLGISDDMIQKLESSVSNIDVEEYLTTARDYLREGGGQAKRYVKKHPGQVAAGVAALAVGVGLLVSALNRE